MTSLSVKIFELSYIFFIYFLLTFQGREYPKNNASMVKYLVITDPPVLWASTITTAASLEINQASFCLVVQIATTMISMKAMNYLSMICLVMMKQMEILKSVQLMRLILHFQSMVWVKWEQKHHHAHHKNLIGNGCIWTFFLLIIVLLFFNIMFSLQLQVILSAY